jgi:DNA-binding NarL/FixJ family response regulator
MIRVFIVSPSPAVRLGLRALLEPPQSIQVVGEAAALDDPGSTAVDVMIYAPVNRHVSRIELNKDWSGEERALLLLTEEVVAVQQLGRLPLRSWGILSPEVTGEELLTAILAVHDGFILMEPFFAKKITQLTAAQNKETSEQDYQPLTEREMEILQLVAQGLSNKQIAAQLKVSPHTVKFHISSIYNKLGAVNRTEAVRFGLHRGLVTL